jgi:pimeloyl-ACP methyl ester carboxylesterase
MQGRRDHWSKAGASTIALALLVVGAVLAQDPAAPDQTKGAAAKGKDADKEKEKGKTAPGRKGLVKTPARTPNKGIRKAVDPLANPANVDGAAVAPGQPLPAPGTFHYRFKIALGDAQPVSVAYYPSKTPGITTPVVMLIHERERSSKDFEESIAELKKLSMAEELQKQGFTVLALDLRNHGASTPRRTLPKAEWANVAEDLQTAYYCLVDRHNWSELNVSKLGVVALGEGANVAASWAARGGAVSEGRTSDLGSLVLVSPMIDAQSQGITLRPAISVIASRVPIDILAGEKDVASAPLIDESPTSVKTIVKRYRSNKVETFPSALHGYKLLQFEPNLTQTITRFLDATSKVKADPWEGRYLLTPVTYTDIKVIKNPVRIDPATKKAAN